MRGVRIHLIMELGIGQGSANIVHTFLWIVGQLCQELTTYSCPEQENSISGKSFQRA